MDFHSLVNHKATMMQYLRCKLEQEDWHAVADAAMDLRELEVELRIQKERIDDAGTDRKRV